MFHLPALSAVLVVTSVWETRWRWPALCLSPGQSWWDSPGTDPTPPPSLPASSSPTLSPGTCQWEELTSRQWSRSWSCAMSTRRTRAATHVWWWTTQTTTRWGFNWPNLKSTLKSCLHPLIWKWRRKPETQSPTIKYSEPELFNYFYVCILSSASYRVQQYHNKLLGTQPGAVIIMHMQLQPAWHAFRVFLEHFMHQPIQHIHSSLSHQIIKKSNQWNFKFSLQHADVWNMKTCLIVKFLIYSCQSDDCCVHL